MTLKRPAAPPPEAPEFIPLPDTPEPKDMTTVRDFYGPCHNGAIAEYLGNEATTLVMGGRYLTVLPFSDEEQEGHRYPDLMIAFGIDPQVADAHNGYVISYWNKPPDFVLEIVSVNSVRVDQVDKRPDYAAMGIPEYWRFDANGGSRNRPRLAGDRLVDERYEPIAIEQSAEDVYRGYSAILNVNLCWRAGEFRWQAPATGEYLRTRDEIRRDEIAALARVAEAEAHAAEVQARAEAAEERAERLKAELRRLRES